MSSRLEKFREKLSEQKLDGFVVSRIPNQRYLSGFSGHADFDAVLLVSKDDARVVTDSRYWQLAEEHARGFTLVKFERGKLEVPQALAEFAQANDLRTIGFEAQHVPFNKFREWQKAARKGHFKLKPVDELIETLRAVKDEAELAKIRRAVELTDRAFAHFCERVRVGMTERQAAWIIESFLRENGGDKLAFDPIVASGTNAASPHAEVTERAFQVGEPITIDIGVKLDGYNSDLTRTITLNEMTDKFKEIYNIVLKAQRAVEKKTRAGLKSKQVDAYARRVIEKAGYGEYFGHGVGHGLGLAVHELPRAGKTFKDVLQENMTLTVEPGIYVPGWGGVRIEDLVVIKKDGVEILSQASKEPLVSVDAF